MFVGLQIASTLWWKQVIEDLRKIFNKLCFIDCLRLTHLMLIVFFYTLWKRLVSWNVLKSDFCVKIIFVVWSWVWEKHSKIKIQNGSRMKIQNGSTIKMQKGSTIKIQIGSRIKIQMGFTIKIQKSSLIKIQKSSRIKMQMGLTNKIHKGSSIMMQKVSTIKI